MYSVQTFREAVPELESQESIIAQNSRCGLVSLTEIEYKNRDALIENRDTLIENQDIVIANRVSILDSCRDRESSVNLLLNGTVQESTISAMSQAHMEFLTSINNKWGL